MRAYADSSFLLSLYSNDAHSPTAARLAASYRPTFLLTPFLEAEFINALELGVFVKRYYAREARAVRERFLTHIRAGVFSPQHFAPETYELARSLSIRHTAKLGTRSLDVLHVASAMVLKAERFLTFDHRRRALARTEGLRVLPSRG